MRYVIINFPKTRSQSVINDLMLIDLLDANSDFALEEVSVDNFFSEELYKILKKYETLIADGACQILGFNYPIENESDKVSLRTFFKDAILFDANLYYYPKPNQYVEVDDFALFSLKRDLTLDNYAIEILYKDNKVDRSLRNKIHPLLRKNMCIDESVLNKKFFYESRKLFNLSWKWNAYTMDTKILHYDLTQRVGEFYPAPKTINIGLTNQCNLKCDMCAFHSPKYKLGHVTNFFKSKTLLQDSYVYKAIDYAVSNNCYSIDFTSPGESLLDNRIFDFIKYARTESETIRIGLLSNAVLLSAEISKKLLDSGLNIVAFSVDGVTHETYEKMRGTGLEKVENNIKAFIEISKEYKNIEISLNCVLSDITLPEKEEYIKKWKSYDERISVNFQGLLEYDEQGTHLKCQPKANMARFACARPWNCQLGILPNGEVAVCCSMGGFIGWKDYKLGNVHELDLEEIWTKSLNKLRKACLDNNFDGFDCCKACTEWSWDIFDDSDQGVVSAFREAIQ